MSDSNSGRQIRPVILAGGAGTRLWPLSTPARPKHMLPLLGDDSLFEQTLRRFGDRFAEPIIVGNHTQEAELRKVAGKLLDARITHGPDPTSAVAPPHASHATLRSQPRHKR